MLVTELVVGGLWRVLPFVVDFLDLRHAIFVFLTLCWFRDLHRRAAASIGALKPREITANEPGSQKMKPKVRMADRFVSLDHSLIQLEVPSSSTYDDIEKLRRACAFK